jgi:glutamine amidotransferase
VLDYGIGNLRSAQKALQHVGGDARLCSSADECEGAAGVALPGVGAFGRCAEELRASGLDKVAVRAVEDGTPMLAVCVGMQLLYGGSDESPGIAGLGVLPGEVHLLAGAVKRPQMQWNQLELLRPSPMFGDTTGRPWAYFVHSYAADMSDDVVATCEYGGPVTAAVERGRLWATQFHPEKSGRDGLALLRRFVDACRA